MAVHRHVTVERIRLKFAAAHMATLGDELEPLHGHNYLVRCRVDGDLTDDRWVIDFSALKRAVREVCDALDHHFLLQERSPLLQVERDVEGWSIRFRNRAYRFPASDVVALPIENTTAELLAEYIAEQVVTRLASDGHGNLTKIAVDVEEMPGQAGGYARDLP
ncbi:MAG: 6-carboxytetrahydropterin synthase [Chloroflexi bacterium]|nr:6-carboxytetrahydropterin synthase [Chloroflexota bacterium]MDA1240213.1 6-carboxytetrahydropterin synthase [Chloroflexota bacterium]MQC47827.1 6-pyruvoyl tetrahydrobiopterin synthase [Chloroflexota bacterium]